jgi:PLD-like domain
MLLSSSEFTRELLTSINASEKKITILSAFIKTEAAKSLLDYIDDRVEVQVVARWKKCDLVCSASDLSLYAVCKERGWKFGVDLNLHGKLFVIDDSNIYLGSANLTKRGLNLGLVGNNEFGTKIPAEESDIDKVSSFVDAEVTWMTDTLFRKISEEYEASKLSLSNVVDSWSNDILDEILKPVEYLWVNELPFTTPASMLALDLEDDTSAHDFALFDLVLDEMDELSLKRNFRRSRVYKWVVGQLGASRDMNFGSFSKALHDALLDDPKPYRKNVKEFLVYIFEWIKFLDEDFEMTKYTRTSSVSLRPKR